jgi:hypothetical protein
VTATEREERRRQQVIEAGVKGRERKTQRAKLRKACRDGRVDALRVVSGDEPNLEELVADWHLLGLIRLVPGIGQVKAFDVLTAAKLSPRMKPRALTKAERGELATLCKAASEWVA